MNIIRLIAASAIFIATPALAYEIKPVGADPAPIFTVQAGDTIVLQRAIGRELLADGSRALSFDKWIDRSNGKGWKLAGATKLRLVGFVTGKGYVYAPIDAVAVATPPPVAVPKPPVVSDVMFGANLSGCEFKNVGNGSLCPKPADVDWYAAAGFTMIRIPVKDENPNARIEPTIDRALALGMTVVIDRHTYRWTNPTEMLTYWKRWNKYRGNMKVVYGLVNEPAWFDSPTITNDWVQWATDTNTVTALFRANGITNTIASGYPGASGLTRFDKAEKPGAECQSAACAIDRVGGLTDSNLWVEAHRYFDANGSGTTAKCAAYGLEAGTANPRLAAAKRGIKLFIGESAFGKFDQKDADTGCQKLGRDAIATMKAHPEVYAGVTWWGGGRGWPSSYPFAIAPKGHANADSWFVRTLADADNTAQGDKRVR